MKKSWTGKCAAIAAAVTIAAAGVSYGDMGVLAAENIITNSTFDSGTSGWDTYNDGSADLKLGWSDGRLAFEINNVGTLSYSSQLSYKSTFGLYKGAKYHISFDISSSSDRFVECMIQETGGDYTAYFWKGLELTSTPQRVDEEFTMEDETDLMTKLVFNCGLQEKDAGKNLGSHTIYLDNVVVEKISGGSDEGNNQESTGPDINLNQVGFSTGSRKTAVFRGVSSQSQFSVMDAATDRVVYTGDLSEKKENSFAGETDCTGDFTEVTTPGKYYIKCDGLKDSYTFEISDSVYDKLVDDSVRMLYMQRCGVEVRDIMEDDGTNHGHPACHSSLATIYGTNEKIDVSGGWHDAGDYGRYVVPGAKAVADILYAYDRNSSVFGDDTGIPESGNGIPDVLDEAKYELDWMMKMQDKNTGGVYHKVTCKGFPGYIMPQEENNELFVTPVSSTATADFAASMALAYEMFKPFDAEYANSCLEKAERAWAYLEQNPGFVYTNPTEITTGDYGDMSRSDRDERYWAAAQLYRATKNDKYYSALSGMSAEKGLDWSLVGDYGNIALTSMDGVDSSLYEKAKQVILSQADTFAGNAAGSPYGLSLTKLEWGSNMSVANAGIILSEAYRLTGEKKYLEAAQAQADYLLGTNPCGKCFVTGFGTDSPQNPHHRPSMAAKKAMHGMLVGGVDQFLEDDAAKTYCKDYPSAKRYVDHSESYSTNEVTIYWNSPLTYLLVASDGAVGGDIPDIPVEVEGDVNNDGKFDISDIVMLQKWLCNKGEITNPAKADMNADGKCNVVDLTIMKRKVFSEANNASAPK